MAHNHPSPNASSSIPLRPSPSSTFPSGTPSALPTSLPTRSCCLTASAVCRSGDLAREFGGHGAAPVVVAPAKLVGRALEGPGAQPVEGALGVGLEVGDHVVGRVQRVAADGGEGALVEPRPAPEPACDGTVRVGPHVGQRVAAPLGEAGVVAPGQARHAPDRAPPSAPRADRAYHRLPGGPPPDRPAGRGADVEVVDLDLAGDDLAGRPPLSGPAIAPRMLLRRQEAVVSLTPSWRASPAAETPRLGRATSQKAANHFARGRWGPCMGVPADTENCRRQRVHCRFLGLRPGKRSLIRRSSQERSSPHLDAHPSRPPSSPLASSTIPALRLVTAPPSADSRRHNLATRAGQKLLGLRANLGAMFTDTARERSGSRSGGREGRP